MSPKLLELNTFITLVNLENLLAVDALCHSAIPGYRCGGPLTVHIGDPH